MAGRRNPGAGFSGCTRGDADQPAILRVETAGFADYE